MKNKFRIWDPRSKLLYYDWYSDDDTYVYTIGWKDGELIVCRNFLGEFDGYESDCIISQCTGILDKDGNDIYEGDIIENVNFIGVMEFHNGAFCLVEKKAKIPVIATNDINTFTNRIIGAIWYDTIIGNIFENPELL